ncbi:malonyl-ACP O-methyltransferase BioC [Neisseria iguanae]|uniref:Malonyl-[acyl-carrier protein] O-methyltransferase n=1 Tax=Neisseria iguanae TaxID=90242 RepID=A0A2P7TZC4_9NEIS|nr:malonyl-ACP O-methyltransferase BioC [Neisseria iguanae]PSJ80041.1 malonyl-[acyl-carrier protein] O-methyltransferase BioC [Neisseria iguanae]
MMPDKQRIAARFAAAVPHYNHHAGAQRMIHNELDRLLACHAPKHVAKILEIGCGTGLFSRMLAQRFPQAKLVLNDLNAACVPDWQHDRPSETEYRFGDAEQIDLGSGYNIIASASALQWLENPTAFVKRAAQMLVSDGLLVFNTFTPDNLHPIRTLTGSGLHYPTQAEWTDWLNRDYDIISLEQRTITLVFDSPRDVLRHLQYTGVTATNADFVWTKQRLQAFEAQYRDHHVLPDSRVGLDYTPLYVAARKKPTTCRLPFKAA